MLSSQAIGVLGIGIALAALPSCANPDEAGTWNDVVCHTYWSGEIPATSTLSVRACLTASACSEGLIGDHYVENAQNPAVNPDCGHCGAGVGGQFVFPGSPDAVTIMASWRDLQHTPTPVTSVEFVLELDYSSRTSSLLTHADRPSLTVQAGTDEMLVDSVALQPFVVDKVPTDPDGEEPPVTCNNAWLNLDGSAQPSPY